MVTIDPHYFTKRMGKYVLAGLIGADNYWERLARNGHLRCGIFLLNQQVHHWRKILNTAAINANTNRTMAILAHIGGLFTSWLAPLVIYLIKKSELEGEFDAQNAREALNFQISIFLAYIACLILSFIVIGIFLFWIVMITNLVLSIVAAVKASNGIAFRYPLTLRFIK